ncbi:MAG: hypothetical protein ACI9CB_001240 [Rhodothermales bacterium]|jgi:uncharacterized protein YyaL (SSP411 family)
MNRLNESSSLYLRQHADNPVHWQPWDEQALLMARETSTPILLSIGYSACHWCHVMAHESFEDPATADLMNKLFVNIKLDREERPDLDKLYQLSHQLLSNRGGGWPLTVFLDPHDLTPFYAGTYFPPTPRHGLPAFKELVGKIREWFEQNKDAVKAQNQRLSEAITSLQKSSLFEGQPDPQVFDRAFEQISSRYDDLHGGFGGAPKFPQAPMLGLLLTMSQMTRDYSGAAQEMLNETLRKMALSGLRDHLDGGFFRYTVDGNWTIPHFEKMLYDNALLLPLYAQAAASSEDRLLRSATDGIAHWLLSEMRHDNGGFYASIDADADGVEGGFHVWQADELKEMLSGNEYEAIAKHFGLDRPPNFEGHFWHLVLAGGINELDEGPIISAKQKMLIARSMRIPPSTDHKQLTSWNALCIEGFARAGTCLQREDWIDAAEQTLEFIRDNLWINGRLFAVYAEGEPKFPAYLDDYAFLLKASLSLLRARWSPALLNFATELADAMISNFEDTQTGGFFYSAADQDAPISRLRPLQDDATPAGNGIAAIALEELGHLTADSRYLDTAGRALMSSYNEIQQHPLAYATLLCGLDAHMRPPIQVIITGPDARDLKAWKAVTNGFDRVNCYLLGPGSGNLPVIPGLNKSTDQTVAYICEGLRCLPPLKSSLDLQNQLQNLKA